MGDEINTQASTQATEGSETTSTATGSETATEIASYKKRQAGADAARQIAEDKAAALEKELAGYRTAAQTAAEKELGELAAERARREASDKRADEAEAKANAKILEFRFPKARAKFPEITDEARLAEVEVLLSDGDFEPPTPTAHNESRSTTTKGTPAKPETAAEIRARLEATPMPDEWA
jgi:hypothetical protein